MGQVYEIQEPDEIELLLQVNGKMHGSLRVPFNASGEEIEALARASDIGRHCETSCSPIKRVVIVTGRLVNIVV